MRYFLKSVLFAIVVISSYCCSSKKEISTKLPEAIELVYFQKWIGGQELSGSGIDFHLKFKNQLPKDTYLTKVYFQNQEAFFDRENETTFIAKIYSKSSIKIDSTIDINKRENPDFPFDLKPTEAILEFHINNKATQVKIENIQEKELLAYPSTRPRN
jgi:hypothetical protein